MLTTDLIRVRRDGEYLRPRFLRKQIRTRLLPVATELVATLANLVGERREDIDSALSGVPHGPSDRVVTAGLRKLLMDRCSFEQAEGVDPVAIREQLCLGAVAARRELTAGATFSREDVVTKAAAALELSIDALELRMFIDLKGNERLTEFKVVDGEALLDRYNLSLAQSILLRANKVSIKLTNLSPKKARELFRAARFHGLLYEVTQSEEGYLIQVDGPMSLFSSVQKYGLKLACFLPSVVRCPEFALEAELSWGKKRERKKLALSPADKLVPVEAVGTGLTAEHRAFLTGFKKLDSEWAVRPNEEIFAFPGETVCIPDFVFENAKTGEQVHLEIFGFWSRKAVWQRVELVEKGFPGRLILAVGKQLRVSSEVLGADAPGALHVYKTRLLPKSILGLLADPKSKPA